MIPARVASDRRGTAGTLMPTIVGQHLLTRKTSGDYHCPTGVGLRLLASKACSQPRADTVPVGTARTLPKGATMAVRGYDVIVVGARVAGAATAMLLARRGLRVLAVDRARFPSDTLSTHQVQVPGVALLNQWGVLDRLRAAGTPATRQVRFDSGHVVLEGRFPAYGGGGAPYSPPPTPLGSVPGGAARGGGAGGRGGEPGGGGGGWARPGGGGRGPAERGG